MTLCIMLQQNICNLLHHDTTVVIDDDNVTLNTIVIYQFICENINTLIMVVNIPLVMADGKKLGPVENIRATIANQPLF